MKLKSIAGLVYYVKDIKKTAKFYKNLGVQVTKDEPAHFAVRLNWFWVDFHPLDMKDVPEFQKLTKLNNKDSGLFIYINVEDIDEFYKGLVKKGLKLESGPKDYPWGNREFLVKDPDGYKIVFFEKK